MLPVLEVAGQLQGGLPLLSGVLLNDGFPPWNVAGAGSIMSTSGGLQLLSGVLLKDASPSLSAASAGSSRSASWGVAAVARCPFER